MYGSIYFLLGIVYIYVCVCMYVCKETHDRKLRAQESTFS